jgi:hypothetical protein
LAANLPRPLVFALWGALIRFSCCEAVFVDESAGSISALDVVWSEGGCESERWRLRVRR